MSSKKWYHNLNQKWFGYRSLFINLAEHGKEDIVTFDESSGIKLITRLYLDGDMSCTIQLPEDASPDDINEDHMHRHLTSVSEKIKHITLFFYQSVGLALILGGIAPPLINKAPLMFDYNQLIDSLYSYCSSAAVMTATITFKKHVGKFMMRQIAGKIFNIRLKGISFNKLSSLVSPSQ